MTNSPTKASVRCSTCGKRFTRTEHLNRHFRSHTRERPFGCSICGKRFSRTDILHRHEVAHEPEATEKVLRATAGNFRACTKCAAARVKCSGDQPCQRCSTRSITCQYPPMKRRKLSGEADRDQAIEVATQNVYVEYTAQGAPIDEAMVHDTTQVDLPEIVPPCEQPSNVVIYQNATAQNLTSLATGQLSPIRRVPNHQLPRSTWSNGSMQSPTGNPIHRQYHDLQNSEDFLLYQNDVQFSNRELSSINWLPLSDSTFENWDFEELSRPIPEESSGHFLSGDVQQPNTARDIMENFEGDENVYRNTTGRSGNDHISPTQTAPVSTYSDSHSTSTANQDERSGYYVDGDGGRITTSVRLRRNRSISKDGSSPHSGRNHISNPISSSSHVEQGSAKSPSWITMETYNEIMDQGSTTPFPTISWGNLNLYVQLYFDKFHSLFPILYKRHIGLHRDGWILVLAAAAVGAAYGNTLESRQHSEELHEFLHRSLEIHHNFQDGEDEMLELDSSIGQRCENSIMLTQARILNVIGMLHSGNQKLLKFAHSSRSFLTAACDRLDLLRPADHIYLDDILSDDDKRQEWLTEQTRIRTGYFIWMVDCMVAYESDFRPQMKLIDAKAPLPCSDIVWESSDLGKDLIFDSKNEPPTLCIAVEALYMEKKVLPNVGDLGRILIIHAIYHRTWDVYNYHRERLSSWTPTARIESIASIPSQAENWLPSIPAVSRWRNIACDALDILHWSANSVIAAAQGLEPPIVLHLHLSRLILLTPVIQIRRLVSSMLQKSSEQSRSSPTNPLGRKNDIETRNEIWRWISQDQYKARLSIIHAGAIFWNIRRYSYSGPIEPFTIYLATLVIWAYGTFAGVSMRRRLHTESSSGNVATSLEVMQNEISTTNANISCPPPEYNSTTPSPGRSPSPDPSFLHLDRPIDDDLVQTYVRQGHKMTGNMGRIGDICEASAPAKILREGAKILNMRERGNRDSSRQDDEYSTGNAVTDGRVTWGVADKFQNLLERLATVVESQDLGLEH